jgi:hypothetical protein
MKNLSTADRSDCSSRASCAASFARDSWADGETRAFIERPYHFALPVRALGVALSLAAVVAAANIAWILANHI